MGLLDNKKREYVEQFDPEWERAAREEKKRRRRDPETDTANTEREDSLLREERERPDTRQKPETQMSSKERRWVIFGALKAALSLALIYIAGAAAVILLIILVYHLN